MLSTTEMLPFGGEGQHTSKMVNCSNNYTTVVLKREEIMGRLSLD